MKSFERIQALQDAVDDDEADEVERLDDESVTAVEYVELISRAVDEGSADSVRYLADQLVRDGQFEPDEDRPGKDGNFVKDTLEEALDRAFSQRKVETAVALYDADVQYAPTIDRIKHLVRNDYRERARELIKSDTDFFEPGDLNTLVRQLDNIPEIANTLIRSFGEINIASECGHTGKNLVADGAAEALKNFLDKATDDEPVSTTYLPPAIQSSNDRETIEFLFESDEMDVSDVDEEDVLEAVHKGHSETILTLMDAGYDEWTDEMLEATTDGGDENEDRTVSDEVVRRFYDQTVSAEVNKDFNRHLFEAQPEYGQGVRELALDEYHGPAIGFTDREQITPDEARRLLDKRMVRRPHQLIRSMGQRTDDTETARAELVDDIDQLSAEEAIIDAIEDNASGHAIDIAHAVGFKQTSEAASKLLKNGWSKKTDRSLASYWNIYRQSNQASKHLPMTVAMMSAHAAAYYQSTRTLKKIIDATDLSYTDVPEPALRHFTKENADCHDKTVGQRRPSVVELYEHASEQSDEEFEYLRDTFGTEPIRQAADRSIWGRDVKKLIRAGAELPSTDEKLFLKALDGHEDIFERLADNAETIPEAVFIKTILNGSDDEFETLIEHYTPDQDAAAQAANRIMAREDVDNTRLHRLVQLDEQTDFTMDWSHATDTGSDSIVDNDPLAFAIDAKHDGEMRTTNDFVDQLVPEPLVRRLMSFGADPTANDAAAISATIRHDEPFLFEQLTNDIDDLSDQSQLILTAAEEKAPQFFDPLVELGVDPNYNDGQAFMALTDTPLTGDKDNIVQKLIDIGVDPTSDGAQKALNRWIQSAGENGATKDSAACEIVRYFMQARREHGQRQPPRVDQFESFSDAPVVEVVCEELPKRQAQSLREQLRGTEQKVDD